MKRPVPNNLCIAIALVLALPVPGPLTTAAMAETRAALPQGAPASASANPPFVFAHEISDLPVDPAARFGRLPNGMTYVIYPNRTPPGQAMVWMRVAAGSAMEKEQQRGLAHFIEHLAFNGSKNVPEGEITRLLERDGLQFGADTNAQTSEFETIYTLTLPDAKPGALSDALLLMRETAGNLLLAQGAIERERGVILGEERARASNGLNAYEAQARFLLQGTIYPERLPIGSVEVIKNAQRPAFVQFYNDFYQPKYTTLVIAGDIDAAKIEADVRKRFSDWQPAAQSPAARTDFGQVTTEPRVRAKVFTAPGLTGQVTLSWVQPPVDTAETRTSDVEDGLYAIISDALSARFARAAERPAAAFVGGGLRRDDIEHTARIYGLSLTARDGQDRAAFRQGLAVLREFLATGPNQDEIDRAIMKLEQIFADRAAAARTRATQDIASQVLSALGRQRVIQSPQQEQAGFAALKPEFTRAAVMAALGRMGLGKPPAIWREGEKADLFTEADILNDYAAEMAAPVTTAPAATPAGWSYTRFGNPAHVVSRKVLRDLGATRVRFANGVVLTVKRTPFEDDAVNITVRTGNGMLGIRPEQGPALFMANRLGLFAGGLGKLTADDIRTALAGHNVGLNFAIGTNATVLSGGTTIKELPLQMQLLTAFMTDPGLRPDALDRVKATLSSDFAAAKTTPDGVYATEAAGAAFGDDPRFVPPSVDRAKAIDMQTISALIRKQLGHGPIEVTMVGDIDADTAIRVVGDTLGAIPAHSYEATEAGTANTLHFPTTDLHRIYYHDGRADQNLSVVIWPTTDAYTGRKQAASLELLAAVMTMRELDEVREKQGASYGATVASTMSRFFPGFGFVISRAAVKPDVDDIYFQTVSSIAEALKASPVSADELNRARLPMLDHLRSQRNSNGYWMNLLSGSASDQRQIGLVLRHERELKAVTPSSIQAAAGTYLNMRKALRIQVRARQ